MSTRRERANRWWLRCPKCGEWKARHCVGGGIWTCQLADEGRRLASQRDDLIAQGVDPADLLVPLHPDDRP